MTPATTPNLPRRLCAFAATALTLALSTAVAFALDPAKPPPGNFDLTHWKLTLPVTTSGATSGTPAEIQPSDLSDSSYYTHSPYTTLYAPYFFTDSGDGAMVFYCPTLGAHTANTSFPRCELREMLDPSDDTVNWTDTGTHTLTATAKVTAVPTSTKVIVGQIHGTDVNANNENPLIKLQFEQSSGSYRLRALCKQTASGSTDDSMLFSGTSIALNTNFTYSITLKDKTIKVVVNGVTGTISGKTANSDGSYTMDSSWDALFFYFKAGTYNQDSSGDSSNTSAHFYSLATSHSTAAPTITTTTLPAGRTTVSYGNQQLVATGGTTPYTWSLATGTLPAGLSLASSTGIISGTPTTAGTSSFTAQVTDAASHSDTQALSITINANSVPNITTTTLPAGSVGSSYSQSVASTGGDGAITWSVLSGSLPAGLALSNTNNQTALISGTPTTAGTSSFTLKLVDIDNDSDTQALSIVVNGVSGDPEIVPTGYTDTTPWDTAGSNGPPQIYDGVTADGGNGSRWASNASPNTLASTPRYVTLDLGGQKNITKFVVWPYQSRAYSYKIYVSTDGTNFGSPVVNVAQTTGATSYTHTLGTAAVGRYVKLLVDGVTGVSTTWASINEFDIFGTAASNTPPTISSISNQTTTTGTAVGPISFTVGDAETAASALTLSGASSNTTLVPNANIVFGGSGASRTVTVTPASGQTGTATITATVTDGGGLTANTTFTVTVNSSGGGTVPVVLEAESVSFDSNWVNIADSNASAGHALQAQTNSTSSAPSNGGLVYSFSLGSSSTIYLQTRTRSPNGGSSDSVWLRLDGGSWAQFVQGGTNTYTWSNKSFTSVAAGAHTFEIRYREAGAVLDQVAVTLTSSPPN